MNSRGGARPGAGRPPKPDPMVTCAFVITREQAEMIAAHAKECGMSKSEWLRRLLDLYADDC